MNKRYRIYNIILSNIETETADSNFAKLVMDKKFEWWRYTALSWILITPVSVSTKQITTYIVDTYGKESSPFFIFEIDINDVGGIVRTISNNPEDVAIARAPFIFFQKIKNPDYIFNWEKQDKS